MTTAMMALISITAIQGQQQAPQPTPEERLGDFEERFVDLEARVLALVTGFPKDKVERPSPEDWKRIKFGMSPSQVRGVLGEPLYMENRVRPPDSYGYRGGVVEFRSPPRARRGTFGEDIPQPGGAGRDYGTKVSSINGPTVQDQSMEDRLREVEKVLGLGGTLRSVERCVGLKPGKSFIAGKRSDVEHRLERIEAKLGIQMQGSPESRLLHIADLLVPERIEQSELRLADFEKRVAAVEASPPDALFSFPRLSKWRSLRLGMLPAGVEKVLGSPTYARRGDRRTEYSYTVPPGFRGLVGSDTSSTVSLNFEVDRKSRGSTNRQGLTSLPEPYFYFETSWRTLLLELERLKDMEAPAQPASPPQSAPH